MFEIYEYASRRFGKHGAPLKRAKPKRVAKFKTLEQAREFIEGRERCVIKYPARPATEAEAELYSGQCRRTVTVEKDRA